MDWAGRRVHVMGIGGCGMRALVPLLQAAGATVCGCDLAQTAGTRALQASGVRVYLGHDSQHLIDIDIVVYSTAISQHHPELQYARQMGMTVLSRPACLASLLGQRPTIAVVGSHGKTTTTWMIGHLLKAAGSDPLVMLGGQVSDDAAHGGLSGTGWAVVEADESDGGFRHVQPKIVVLTNLEAEHQRYYGSFSAMVAALAAWIDRLPADGRVIVPSHGLDSRLLAAAGDRVVPVGLDHGWVRASSYQLQATRTTADIVIADTARGRSVLAMPGQHMLHNALMAIAATELVAAPVPLSALASCRRVARRFTDHGSYDGVSIVEDYAHHPTEIAATLAAAALAQTALHVVIQPHRYSRLADCFSEFIACFDLATSVCVLPVYAAGEHIGEGPDSTDLVAAVMRRWQQQRGKSAIGMVQAAPKAAAACDFSTALAAEGSCILLLGAGDIGAEVPRWIEALKQRQASRTAHDRANVAGTSHA